MRAWFGRIASPAFIGLIVAASILVAPVSTDAQGGEPQYFAIRGARVVPLSGPPMEDATVVVARGVIVAVGKGVTIPADASQADVETATLALDAVRRALDGRPPRKIVVVPKRIVNVVG